MRSDFTDRFEAFVHGGGVSAEKPLGMSLEWGWGESVMELSACSGSLLL